MVNQRYRQYGMDKDQSVDNLNKYVEDRLHGQMSSTSQEQNGLLHSWKPEDFEQNALQKTLDPPKHAKMTSAAVTEMAFVPPIIQNVKSNESAGGNSAFSKRLPEIQ